MRLSVCFFCLKVLFVVNFTVSFREIWMNLLSSSEEVFEVTGLGEPASW